MTRKTWASIFGLVLSTTIVGIILTPLVIISTPVILIRPSIVNSLYATATEKFMKAGTQMMVRSMKIGRTARI